MTKLKTGEAEIRALFARYAEALRPRTRMPCSPAMRASAPFLMHGSHKAAIDLRP